MVAHQLAILVALGATLGGCATPEAFRFENQLTAFNNPLIQQSSGATKLDNELLGDEYPYGDRRDPLFSDLQQLNDRLRDSDFPNPDPAATRTQVGGSTPPPRSIIPTSEPG